jgi:DNA-binding transcriptional LysR family regulator
MIDKLGFLMALARERHFGRAAKACGVAQPTLSAGLKQLEDLLGATLVQRGARFIGLTADGERVLEWARRIVGDAKAMRDEITALRRGQLSGQVTIAVIPTAVAAVTEITAPFRIAHPDVTFRILSRTSIEILLALENLEIDAGITYLENEPLRHVRSVPLYGESYCLLTAVQSSALGDRETVDWAELASLPLCLLTQDMQNRRIVERQLQTGGATRHETVLEADSMLTLFAHVRTGLWATIVPAQLIDLFDLHHSIRSIPIVAPSTVHAVGLIVPDRGPAAPLAAALVSEARRAAARLARATTASEHPTTPSAVPETVSSHERGR